MHSQTQSLEGEIAAIEAADRLDSLPNLQSSEFETREASGRRHDCITECTEDEVNSPLNNVGQSASGQFSKQASIASDAGLDNGNHSNVLASAAGEKKKMLSRLDSRAAASNFADGNEHEFFDESEEARVSSVGSPQKAVCPPPEKSFDAALESSDLQTTAKQFSPPPEKFSMPKASMQPLPKSDLMSFMPDEANGSDMVCVPITPSPPTGDDQGFSNLGDLSKRQAKPMCKMGCGRPVADGISKFGRAYTTCCRKCGLGEGMHSRDCQAYQF